MMQRRDVLRTGLALTGSATLSGCLETLGFKKESAWRNPPLVQNRPDAVYYPAYVEGMGMYGTATSGDYRFALMYSYPHRFWNVTGQTANKVVVQSDDTLHVMVSLWDPKTKTALPTGIRITITKDGETVVNRAPWPMLSQNMGFHYGDNVSLDGEGSYTATLQANPLQINRTGAFASRFATQESVDIQFEFNTDDVYGLEFRQVGEKQGSRGAIEPMMENVPAGRAPKPQSLPGRTIGTQSFGDADFVLTLVEGPNRFTDNGTSYLAVSPRTPYNQIVLPRMSLSATLKRNGSSFASRPLAPGLDPELNVHYGIPVKDVKAGDIVQLIVDSPPQLARHDGYETAFTNMASMTFTI